MVERLTITVGQDEIVFETGRIAKQAHGSVLIASGETMVLSASCVGTTPSTRDFFPLTVDFREKSYAAGRIPGNFFRREGRPTEREILVCRLTDRPIRPLFPKGFMHEVQVCQTVYSADNEHDPDVLSINAASASLHISRIPFNGPIGAVRVGLFDGELQVNPPMSSMLDSDLDIVVAGTKDAVGMVEGSAKEVTDEKMAEALEFAHSHIKAICGAIEELRERAGVEKMAYEPKTENAEVVAEVEAVAADGITAAFSAKAKHEIEDTLNAARDRMHEAMAAKHGEEEAAERAPEFNEAFNAIEKRMMRARTVDTNTRVDGRAMDEVRNISIEVGLLPRAHGSCLFTRGETQAMVATTLGTSRDEQRIDELTGDEFRRFMLHYNFPSWSVGEVRRIMGPGRREVGHGKLAERALMGIVPTETDEESFPYVIRVVSDITESNGSSSMASVCGGTMSMMDAGIPIKAPVAGIAMGLIKEGEEVRILSDILGIEDHLGDMDFKVCGTEKGITAFQMDCKIGGVSGEIMGRALEQARAGRLHILGKMTECLTESRSEISAYAPRIYTIKIDVEKIRDVIGPGGKVIRAIQTSTGAEIEVKDDGTINVAAVDRASAEAAIEMLEQITADVEIGKVYKGTVTRTMNFGAFVAVLSGKEGLVHISELAPKRVDSVTDVVNVGDEIEVKVTEIDRLGRVNMSKVAADLDAGRISKDDIERDRGDRPPPRDRGGRGGDRGGRGGDRGGRGGGRPRSGGGREGRR